MDVVVHIEEEGECPPALFANRQRLTEWANKRRLEILPVGNRSIENVCQLTNDTPRSLRLGETLVYDQLWVRASYTAYRSAFRDWHAGRDKVLAIDLAGLHADHVCSRALLRRQYSDAWVVLFPVPSRANTGFGSRIERKLCLGALPSKEALDALMLFKLLCGVMPKSNVELEHALVTVVGGLLPRGRHADSIGRIRDSIDTHLRQWLVFRT
jgi:hypothetical protein